MKNYHANIVSYHASGAAARSLDEERLSPYMKTDYIGCEDCTCAAK
jgi:hypothetical protein